MPSDKKSSRNLEQELGVGVTMSHAVLIVRRGEKVVANWPVHSSRNVEFSDALKNLVRILD